MDFQQWRNAYDERFNYSPSELVEQWRALHQWDGEPLPDAARVAAELNRYGQGIVSETYRADPARTSERLLSGWRDFHAGLFGEAVQKGLELGPIGHYLASAAASIYAFYLADPQQKLPVFEFAYHLAHSTARDLYEHTNTHYMYACNLGRWGEGVSKIKALQHGVPLKFRSAILKTLEMDPTHIYARTGFGAFQGTIISESSETFARLTFGATREKCYEVFEGVIADAPAIPLPTMQYGRAILGIEGKKKGTRGYDFIRQASVITPRDVMEKLDARYASTLLN